MCNNFRLFEYKMNFVVLLLDIFQQEVTTFIYCDPSFSVAYAHCISQKHCRRRFVTSLLVHNLRFIPIKTIWPRCWKTLLLKPLSKIRNESVKNQILQEYNNEKSNKKEGYLLTDAEKNNPNLDYCTKRGGLPNYKGIHFFGTTKPEEGHLKFIKKG